MRTYSKAAFASDIKKLGEHHFGKRLLNKVSEGRRRVMCLSKERAARQGYGKRRGTFETMLEVVGSCIRRLQKPGFYFVCSVCVEGALQDFYFYFLFIFLFLFSLCMVFVFACVWKHMTIFKCGGPRLMSEWSLVTFPFYSLRQGLSVKSKAD